MIFKTYVMLHLGTLPPFVAGNGPDLQTVAA